MVIEKNSKKIVFYDGKCGICRREISFYRSIADNDKFVWIDVTRQSDLSKFNLKLVDVLKNLHVIQGKKVFIAIDAFIVIWSDLKYFKYLAAFVALPIIRNLASVSYDIFARYRFNNLKHCQVFKEDQ